MKKELLRGLPSVDEVLRGEGMKDALKRHSLSLITAGVRAVLDGVRAEIISGRRSEFSPEEVLPATAEWIEAALKPSVVRVINASGTVLHTNLGRAVLGPEAVRALELAATGTVDLEFDVATGKRGHRDNHVEGVLSALTSAGAASVVNNNAAAVLLVLNTLAEGREVIISRGELVEIGGSFRLPEIIEKSGCRLKEVGTTNRTHPLDYASAITEDTALILKAHTSNYEVVGFTSEVGLAELVEIGRERNIPVVEDLGSGSLVDLSVFGIKKEPIVSESVAAGADVVTFSGDKLLGGPQAGLIVGRKTFVERINKNPLKRALRPDKLTLAALDATLRLYLEPEKLSETLPTLRFLSRPLEEIEAVAKKAKRLLQEKLGEGYTVELADGESVVGSGSLPGHSLPTKVLVVTRSTMKPEEIFKKFLSNDPPILGRVSKERFLLDMRTIERAEDVVPE
ncbi:MAG: L-seryl-tRNA(Sec) selenium transferase [Thermodesulfobacteriota bacterium]